MKASLDHLPEAKRAQLAAMTAAIRADAPDIGMVILFGSHARGDWVEDLETQFRSDYDLLVVVDRPELAADASLWQRVEAALRTLADPWPVTLLVEDLRDLNQEIRRGQFFWAELVEQGIALHDARRFQLAKPRGGTPEERRDLAQEYFDQWFTTGGEFFAAYELMVTRQSNSIAAFQLHQATERYLCAALLVFTGTKPNIHDLEKLGTLASPLHPLLAVPFPFATEQDKHLFGLLKRAYIEARYKRGYRITAEKLTVLGDRVRDLATRVERACREQIAAFAPAVSG